jgi:hypothetical protein
MPLTKMCFCYPEDTRPAVDADGKTLFQRDRDGVMVLDRAGQPKVVLERVPGHKTRLARSTDSNVWFEDVAPRNGDAGTVE